MFRPQAHFLHAHPPVLRNEGFTLIELLLVVAMTGILAALLLPALSAANARASQTRCVNNLKQLAMSAQMYSSDNDGKLVVNLPVAPGFDPDTNAWVCGNMQNPRDATNQMLIRAGKLFPYASQLSIYRCPADSSRSGPVPRVRSYSMNSWMGSRFMESHSQRSPAKSYRTFVKENEVAVVGPATLWVIADEHEATIDDAWFLVTMDDTRPFASAPALRHNYGYALNFADGHAEVVKMNARFRIGDSRPYDQVSARNEDWIRFKQITTAQ